MSPDLTVAGATELAGRLLTAAGVPAAAATRTAQSLVLADAWGIASHGLLRLPFYLERLAAGGCNPKARLMPVTDTGPLVTYDGQNGLGHWQAWHAAETARDRCAASGVAVVAVGRSSHCGALGVYTLPLLEAGLAALVFSHGPAVMPPPGGHAAVVSTSPVAAGIPSRPRPAIVDMATSAVSRGRIAAHAQRGEPIPPGWAVTASGEPTTDPQAALEGMLAPLGGPKGFAFAFLVEALTGGLVGPVLSTGVADMLAESDAARPQQIAHLVIALAPSRLGVDGGSAASDRLDLLAARVTAAGGRIPGSQRVLPGELDGQAPLPVSRQTRQQITAWARRLKVPAADG